MSQANVEAVKRGVEARNRGDIAALLSELDASVEWYDAVPMMRGGETTVYRGHAGARTLNEEIDQGFGEGRIELTEIRDLGERVVATGRLHARGSGSGAEAESPYGLICDFRNGKAIRIRTYLSVGDALEAAEDRG